MGTNILKSLGWTTAILGAACFGKEGGLDTTQTGAMILALSGGAVATLRPDLRRGRCGR